MTNKEYLISQLGFTPSNQNAIEGALIDAEITAGDSYNSSNRVLIKTAALDVLRILLSTADTEQGTDETRQSVKFDREAVTRRIRDLELELGITSGVPRVKGVQVW